MQIFACMCFREAVHNLKLSFKEENWGLSSQMRFKCLMAEHFFLISLIKSSRVVGASLSG